MTCARHLRPLLLLAVVAMLPACGSGGLQLPADSAGTPLFEQGQAALEEEDWNDAAQAFDTLLRNYPTSPHLPEARLGLGRAYFEQGRSDTLLLAIDAFRNFITYHPSHSNVDYAQLMIGLSYAELMRSADRDQSNTKRALEAFDVFLEDYPDSSYVEQARERRQQVVDRLALHELEVAEWQLGRGHLEAARQRCHYALRNYPDNGHGCELIWILAEAYRRDGEREQANSYYSRLLEEHPQCERAADARERLNEGGRTASVE